MSDTSRTDSKTLAKAMRILSQDIQSDDGVANAAISEAADRIEQLERELAAANRKIKRMENAAEIILESCPTTWQEDVWNRAKEEKAS